MKGASHNKWAGTLAQLGGNGTQKIRSTKIVLLADGFFRNRGLREAVLAALSAGVA